MHKEVKLDADKIKILSIKTLGGKIECTDDIDPDEIAAHTFSFELSTALSSKNQLIGQKLKVNIGATGKNGAELPASGSYIHEIIFEVEGLNEFLMEEDGKVQISSVLGSVLVGILYSTVRGIIFTRTQGTSLGTVILPVLAPLRLMGLENLTKGQPEATRSTNRKKKLPEQQPVKRQRG